MSTDFTRGTEVHPPQSHKIMWETLRFCTISCLHYKKMQEEEEEDYGLMYVPSYTNKLSSLHNCPKATKMCLWFGVVGYRKCF